ncbi:ABC transporter ATP-binding protein [Methylobacterium terricola]|uniref:ABC transporter ATP-binding protein n=1 Tax=Methylobacterium terricola TaxID=2583531 RepID=A0A5C4L8Y0_9HYPH|nr:ABC transporter ATP-binding protein [Methylobacterium terricola]TNC08336.1 ABC transporter ATP-binding protein [Methylobacterium terricola]
MAGIRIESLAKRYNAVSAVDGVTLDVRDGEFLVLLGPSGCGKTTTLRMIAGFVAPSEGCVRIGARDVTHEPPYRRNIGLVFQNYALFPHLTVEENVAFGLRRRRVGEAAIRTRVATALSRVKLDGFGGRYPRAMSGGQQQRVAIARAIVIEPDVLLLDEPLSNLDAQLRHDVRGELRRLQTELGITTIMVTHDQDEAMSVADRLAVMEKGQVRQVGTPSEIYRRPADRFVASFVGRANFYAGRAERGIFVTASGLRLPVADLAEGADTLMIRPEAVGLRPAGADGLAATVETATYLGAGWELELRLAGGERLSVVAPDAGEHWRQGQILTAHVAPTAGVGMRTGS